MSYVKKDAMQGLNTESVGKPFHSYFQVFHIDNEDVTPLHLAAMDGSVEMTQLLLDSVDQEKLEEVRPRSYEPLKC